MLIMSERGMHMKIAIATDGLSVSGHFGQSKGFQLYNIEGDHCEKGKMIACPKEHVKGQLPDLLGNESVNVVIAGGMGFNAVEKFKGYGIEVLVGMSGSCDDIAKDFIAGNLKSTNSFCSGHDHDDHEGCHH